MKKMIALLLALALCLCACGAPVENETEGVTVTDMIGREVVVNPGSYTRVVCIGAGALRMYSYVGDAALLCGVEDIDNTTLEQLSWITGHSRSATWLTTLPTTACWSWVTSMTQSGAKCPTATPSTRWI